MIHMPSRIPDSLKSLAIRQWLEGARRDTIAADTGLSAGAVTNIMSEWRAAVGSAKADELRELGTSLRRVGITPGQCAHGFRVAMIMKNLGVTENNFESFIVDVYNRCKDDGLCSEEFAELIKDMVEFSEANAVPLSEISEHIRQKGNEKNRLEEEIREMRAELKALEDEKVASVLRRDTALHEENMTRAQIESYSDLREELKSFGLYIDDLSKFTNLVHGLSQMGYDVGKVVNEFSDLDSMREDYCYYKAEIPNMKMKYNGLKNRRSSLEQIINSHNQTLSVFKELKDMGFGLNVLKLLRNTINKAAFANNIPADQAVQKFCKDIEEQYDLKVGFESKLSKARSENDIITRCLNIARKTLLDQPVIGAMLKTLFEKGIREQDIIDVANLFERSSNNDKEALLEGLMKYQIVKTIVEKLNQQIERLRENVSNLYVEKERLDQRNQRMRSLLARSKETVVFLGRQDSLNHYEAEDENVKLLIMISLFLQNLYIGHGGRNGAKKLIDDDLDINKPVGESTSKGLPELKNAVAKFLTVMIDKLDTKREQQSN
jgi:predicted acetyltransferase